MRYCSQDAINKIKVGDKHTVTSQNLKKKVLIDYLIGTDV